MNFKPEILSPAGGVEGLVAAVRSGADAVYLGGESFNARRGADNFSTDELKDAVSYCHTRGVKVYLTLNIAVFENELNEALSFAAKAYSLGVDGFIVSDLGLIKLLNEKLPDAALHASTQLTVCSAAAIAPLKKLGVTRVVAAREMNKQELYDLCLAARNEGVEVEVFVHGALCMCVSGQCLLSATLGGRSGNRGLCAGPCRLPFKAENGTGFDLSLKDLSLLNHLGELSDMGVASFKIEGRMKRAEYVAAATAAVRQIVDTGSADPVLLRDLENVFSRSGFTSGYYTNALGRDMFGIRTEENAAAAKEAHPRIHEYYRGERRSVPISALLYAKEDERITLTLYDNSGNTVSASAAPPEKAINISATAQSIRVNIEKLGGTPYYLESFKADIGEGLAIRTSLLNALRKEAVELLNAVRGKTERQISAINYQRKAKSDKQLSSLVARFMSLNTLPNDLSGLKAVVLPPKSNISAIKANYPDIAFIADLPRVPFDQKAVEAALALAKQNGFDGAAVHNVGEITPTVNSGLKMYFGLGTNIFNSAGAEYAQSVGAAGITLSAELTAEQIKDISTPVASAVFGYGRLPLMLTRNCPLKNGKSCKECGCSSTLCDRKNVEFPVVCENGVSVMYNSLPVWLADRKDEIKADYMLLYFTTETKEEAERVIAAFKNGSAPITKHTRGMTYRGVK